jgi:hypothetical protein
VQNTSLQGAVEACADENGQGDSAVKHEADPVQSPVTPPVQPGNAGGAQTEKGNKEKTEPEVRQQI